MKPPSTLNCSLQALDFQQAWSPLDFVTPGHTSRPFEFLRKLLSPFPFLFPSRHMRAYIIIELSRKLKSGQRGSKRGNISGKVFGCGTRWSSNSKGEREAVSKARRPKIRRRILSSPFLYSHGRSWPLIQVTTRKQEESSSRA